MGEVKINPVPETRTQKEQELLDRSDWGSARITRKEGITQNMVFTSVDYSVLENDRFVIVDTAVTITLPNVNAGKMITIKSTVAGTVTIDGGDFNIDGSATTTLTAQYEWSNFVFNGSEWSEI